MLITDSYHQYVTDTINLVRSFVIKSIQTIDAINQFLLITGEKISNDPRQWKYYKNLAGIPYIGLNPNNSDPHMRIYSLDTNEIVSFNVSTIQTVHPLTYADLITFDDTYKKLLAKYPENDMLIRGILNPIDIQTAIDADDYTILNYDKKYLGQGELTLINQIQEWINNFISRWDVPPMAISDTLYSSSFLAILFLNLVPTIINLRLKNCKTNYVHEFHIWNYLSSYYNLDKYKNVIPFNQAMFLYRNIDYITHNAGKTSTLNFLERRFAFDFGLQLYSHDVQQNIGNNLNNLDAGKITELTNDIKVNKYPYGLVNKLRDPSKFITTEATVKKLFTQALLNPENYQHDVKKLTESTIKTPTTDIPTGIIECEVIKNATVNMVNEIQEKIHNWFYLVSNNLIDYKYNLILSTEGLDSITITANDAAILLMYATQKLNSNPTTDLINIQMPMVRDILINRELSDSDYHKVIEEKYSTGKTGYPAIDGFTTSTENTWNRINQLKNIIAELPNPNNSNIINVDIFKNYVAQIIKIKIQHILLLNLEKDSIGKGELDFLIKLFYNNSSCTFINETTYSDFFDRLKISPRPSEYSNKGLLTLIETIFTIYLGIEPETIKLQHPYKDMVEILRTLSSYLLQFVEGDGTDKIEPIDWEFNNTNFPNLNRVEDITIISKGFDNYSHLPLLVNISEFKTVDQSYDTKRLISNSINFALNCDISIKTHLKNKILYLMTPVGIGHELYFSTAIDFPPLLINSNPLDNETNVVINTDIVLTFNENVYAGDGIITINNDALGFALLIDINGNMVAFNNNVITITLPTNSLLVDTDYYLLIPTDTILDSANNSYGGISDKTRLNFKTINPPPTLSVSNPLDNTTNIATDISVVLTFNEPVQPGIGNITISNGGSDIRIINILSGQIQFNGNIVTITLDSLLSTATNYFILIDFGAILDLENASYSGINSNTVLNFTTVILTPIPPLLISTVPSDNVTDLTNISYLSLVLDKNIKAGIGNIYLTSTPSAYNGNITENYSVSILSTNINISTNTVTWLIGTQGITLYPGTDYSVQVDSGAILALDNSSYAGISDSVTFNFSTLVPNPTLTNSSPLDNATAIAIGNNIILTFSENVQIGTGVITISNGSTDIRNIDITSTEIIITGAIVTINPTGDLLNSTNYSVTMNSGVILNTQGKPFIGITDPTVLNFTTESSTSTDHHYLYLQGDIINMIQSGNNYEILDSSVNNWQPVYYANEGGGFLSNNVSVTNSVFKQGGGSLMLNGNSNLEYSYGDVNPLFSLSSWTMEFYVRDASSSTNILTFKIVKGSVTIFSLLVGTNSNDPVKLALFGTDIGVTLAKNTWGFIRIIKRTNNTYELYKGSTLITSVNNNVDLTTNDNLHITGGNYTAGISYIDEFILYDSIVTLVPTVINTSSVSLPYNIATMVFGSGVFAAFGYGAAMVISSDGITWTLENNRLTDDWHAVAYNGTYLCAILTYGNKSTASSGGGVFWSLGTMPLAAAWKDIAALGNKFCAISSDSSIAKCTTSTNGTSWTTAIDMPSTASWIALAANTLIYCAIAYDDLGDKSTGSSTTMAISSDGINWTLQTLPFAAKWVDIAWNGNIFFAIAENTNQAAITTDGINWTIVTLPINALWKAIDGKNGVFVAVASNNTMFITSTNGTDWVLHDGLANKNWKAVAMNDVDLVCFGADTLETAITNYL